MIAQYLAVDHPELVEKLVLAVTLPGPNETMQKTVNGWKKMAEEGQYKNLMIDTAENSYSAEYLKNTVFFIRFAGGLENRRILKDFLFRRIPVSGMMPDPN